MGSIDVKIICRKWPQLIEQKAMDLALAISDEDVEINRKIGEFGLDIISKISNQKKGDPVNILTHRNAGWLATVDWGTATSPMYQAYDKGILLKYG